MNAAPAQLAKIAARIPAQTADRLVGAAVAGGAILSGWIVFKAVGQPAIAAAFGGTVIALGVLLLLARHLYPPPARAERMTDWALVRDAADNGETALAVIDRNGRLVCTNALYDSWFGSAVPTDLSAEGADLVGAGRAAWRDGHVALTGRISARNVTLDIARSGQGDDCLVWRFREGVEGNPAAALPALLDNGWGDRLGAAGIMVALIGGEGRVRAANRVLILRATGRSDAPIAGRDFVTLLTSASDGAIRFAQEGLTGLPLRLLQIPLDTGREDGDRIIVLIDDEGTGGTGTDVPLQMLLSMLPLGLALADRDGRFLYLNDAFVRAAGVAPNATPVYPGDLVIREDKAAVADAVRRFANGQAVSGDIAVRLKDRPDDPVALTIAGARGLGEAAVLLSLKDNTEESKLQRQVAQATKMQAVGQLAGGVAHDFNNILTGILGHCDLMLMRHTPGDSDYDDIQQIRNNSNRAAGLTRQLLAFSRQQTLRPQVLQLPDVVSEVSNLLQRLLGETVDLVINHGRALGAVRADPGQIEQVIVNLVVNARDAIQAKGDKSGKVTLKTYRVTADEVRKLDSDFLPVADYTALSVSDTGTGIAPENLSKIFEPFFTTKDVGKGTGLGLSTVYGIVKQSGGFIFADSELGQGTTFSVFLPVHFEAEAKPAPVATPAAKPAELWGTGTILLVEDEDMVRAVAERALVRHGYTVLTAAHGEEAMAILGTGTKIDLIVSDVVMPTMDGPTLGRAARAEYPDLPILFMSGYAEEQLRKTIDLDRMGFIPKPFSVKALAEAVQATLAL
jgi:two-component system, cell cycle sensor histidine kinase and response regulator CckA